jgi:hypothetical protein
MGGRPGYGLLTWLKLALGVIGLPQAATAQDFSYRSAASVPASWSRYAELVQFRIMEWMSAETEAADRLHAFLESQAAAGAASTIPDSVVVKIWVGPDGIVQKVDIPPLGSDQARADFRALLTAGNVGESPPGDMLQPLQLRLSLKRQG